MKTATLTIAALLFGAPAVSAETDGLRGAVAYLQAEGWSDIEIERHDGRIRIEAERARVPQGWVYHHGRLAMTAPRRGDDDPRAWVRYDGDDRYDDGFDDDDDDDRWGGDD